jgi:hypothetical protein
MNVLLGLKRNRHSADLNVDGTVSISSMGRSRCEVTESCLVLKAVRAYIHHHQHLWAGLVLLVFAAGRV